MRGYREVLAVRPLSQTWVGVTAECPNRPLSSPGQKLQGRAGKQACSRANVQRGHVHAPCPRLDPSTHTNLAQFQLPDGTPLLGVGWLGREGSGQ